LTLSFLPKNTFFSPFTRACGTFFHFFLKKNENILCNCQIYITFAASINPNNKKYMEVLAKIEAAYAAFVKDAKAQAEKGNKTAGTRARVASLEIEKLMKEFRKASLAAGK
jgi:hypothetical protein